MKDAIAAFIAARIRFSSVDSGAVAKPAMISKYWKVRESTNEHDGIITKDGIASSADALKEIFRPYDPNDPKAEDKRFSLDCASAILAIQMHAILETLVELNPEKGKELFDRLYAYRDSRDQPKEPKILIMGRKGSTVPTVPVSDGHGAYKTGDYHSIANPDAKKEDWHNENILQMERGSIKDADGNPNRNLKVFGHPFGVTTLGEVMDKLDGGAKVGQKRPASLMTHHERVDAKKIEAVAKAAR